MRHPMPISSSALLCSLLFASRFSLEGAELSGLPYLRFLFGAGKIPHPTLLIEVDFLGLIFHAKRGLTLPPLSSDVFRVTNYQLSVVSCSLFAPKSSLWATRARTKVTQL